MSKQDNSVPNSGPETTSIQIVADVLSTAARHRMTESEQNAVAALPRGQRCCSKPMAGSRVRDSCWTGTK